MAVVDRTRVDGNHNDVVRRDVQRWISGLDPRHLEDRSSENEFPDRDNWTGKLSH